MAFDVDRVDLTVSTVDDRTLLSPDVMEIVVREVLARLDIRDGQLHRERADAQVWGSVREPEQPMTVLARARFQRLPNPGANSGSSLDVQYNPTELTFTKGAQLVEIPIPGLDSPLIQFVRGQTETMSLDLFFDSSDEGQGAGATPVTELTDEFYDLVKIDPTTHAPPVLLFSWGGESFPGKDRSSLRCVVASVRQQYTFFSPEGVPLRARLTVELKEYKTLDQQMHELNLQSADHTKTIVARAGDTITSIAHRSYGNDREWRLIADENAVVDPLRLQAGTILRVPRAM